jgi:tripartite-type tricarboxylate transporter receptor subunit TctC
MMAKRIFVAMLVAAGFGLAPLAPAAAQQYPSRVIKLIVPFPPGGPIDTMARIVAHELVARLATEVIVENRPGAGSTLGSRAVAAADPDGYTLFFGSSGSLAVAPALYPKLNLDVLKLFAPVASVALLPQMFVVTPTLPVKTIREFVAYAKANPGKLNYGAGVGTPPHLLSTLLKIKAGIDVTFVPYKGAAASVTDLIAGQTHYTIDALGTLYPFITEGKLRALGMARSERSPAFPDVPTLPESGYPDFTHDAWTGVVAPAGTPSAVIGKLNAAINAALKSPQMQDSLAKFHAIAQAGTPEDFAAYMRREGAAWAEMVKLAGAAEE